MKDLTDRFVRYRECLKDIWNKYFSEDGDWDDRMYFSNAAIELFRTLVLHDCEDRDQPLLPSYRGDQSPVMSIRVTLTGLSEKVRVSADHTFAQSSGVGNDRDLRQAGLAFVDFWDHYPLSTREFAFVCAEVIAAGGGFRSGERALIPFELVKFTHHGNEALK